MSDDIEPFMEILGAKYEFGFSLPSQAHFSLRFQYEYLKVGTRVVVRLEKCKADILVTKIRRLQEKGNLSTGIDTDATRYHVELGASVLEKDVQAISQELAAFSSQLFPCVS